MWLELIYQKLEMIEKHDRAVRLVQVDESGKPDPIGGDGLEA